MERRSPPKARNLTNHPAESIHLDRGDDVAILEGTAVAVDLSAKSTFRKLDGASRTKYDVPRMVMPEGVVYSVRPRVVLAWTEKGFPEQRETRWTFNIAA